MTRAKLLLLSVTAALAIASGTPAFALNPQPLPPGHAAPTHIVCKGTHFRR
jgi:hypothetical protein